MLRTWSRVLLLPLICLPARAAETDDMAALAGHYYLQGVMEVGSELLLNKDGRFQWALSYGAMDQSAQGRWQLKGDRIELQAKAPSTPPQFRLFKEDELRLKKAPETGSWVAIVGVPRRGPIAGVEVRFESKSGKTLTAISGQNGDAIVHMPANEQWVRAGLRVARLQGEWQWLVLPAERSRARIAAFAVDDETWLLTPAFERLQLKRSKNGLQVDDPALVLGGEYVKH